MKISFQRGHKIKYINDNWVYCDTNQLVSENKDRPCGNCGKKITHQGHDGCLGELPDVMNACCGHGDKTVAYIQFWDGTSIQGRKAIEIQKKMQKGKG